MDLYILDVKINSGSSPFKEYVYAYNLKGAINTVLEKRENYVDNIQSIELYSIVEERSVLKQEVK